MKACNTKYQTGRIVINIKRKFTKYNSQDKSEVNVKTFIHFSPNVNYNILQGFVFCLSITGPPPPLPPLQPSGMDTPPNSITSSVPTIVTSGMRSSLPQASLPLFTSGSGC